MMTKFWQFGSHRGISHVPALTIFVLVKFVLVNGSCPTNWTEWNLQFCYKAYGETYQKMKSWEGAKNNCVNVGGHLASIHSSEEMSFLSTFIIHSGYKTENLWIGLNDNSKEMDFQWSDLSPFDYSNWNAIPSNDNNQNCVIILSETSGQFRWAVSSCNGWYPYICKQNSSRDEDNRRQVYTSVKNKMLLNHVIRVKKSSSLLHCSSLCLTEDNCKSFSYGKNACYLNSATDKDFPDDLMEKDAFVYAVPIK